MSSELEITGQKLLPTAWTKQCNLRLSSKEHGASVWMGAFHSRPTSIHGLQRLPPPVLQSSFQGNAVVPSSNTRDELSVRGATKLSSRPAIWELSTPMLPLQIRETPNQRHEMRVGTGDNRPCNCRCHVIGLAGATIHQSAWIVLHIWKRKHLSNSS